MKSIIIILIFSNILFSASFDCSKANTAIERNICTNSLLNKYDEDIGDLYSLAKQVLNEKEFNSLRIKQRQWMKERSKCINDKTLVSCLELSYKNRIEFIHSLIPLKEVKDTYKETSSEYQKNKALIQKSINELENKPYKLLQFAHKYPTLLLSSYALYIKYNYMNVTNIDKDFNRIVYMLKHTTKEYYLDTKSEEILNDITQKYKKDKLYAIQKLILHIYYEGFTSHCLAPFTLNWEVSQFEVNPIFGGSMSSNVVEYCKVDKKNIFEIASVKKLQNLLYDMIGSEYGPCSGTIRSVYGATQWMAKQKIHYVPQSIENLNRHNQHNTLLKSWSYKGIWNKYTYDEYKIARKNAILELTSHYISKFNTDDTNGYLIAKNVVDYLEDKFLNHYNVSLIDDIENDIYFTTFFKKVSIQGILNIKSLDVHKALQYALISNQDETVIDYLLSLKININQGKESLLFYALNNPKYVQKLIDYGANVNYSNEFGKTPIMSAIQIKNLDSIKVLIENGADLTKKTIVMDTNYDTCYDIRKERDIYDYIEEQGTNEIKKYIEQIRNDS